ncbi:MAG: FeoA family protein [Desulfobulbaceae bacterium]|jgi:ferrous iron transport protein A|nr:FeoA family protein [Desulfobulbaceae bacterium]
MRSFLFKKKCAQTPPENCGEQCLRPCQTLRDIEVGKCVCIRRHSGCKKMRRRLLDLGLTPQTKVNIVQKAPLGDPILLKVGDYNLSLSLSEAGLVEVEPA